MYKTSVVSSRGTTVFVALFSLGCSIFAPPIAAQENPGLKLQPASPIHLPIIVDSNSPMLWRNGKLRIFSSSGDPLVHTFSASLQHIKTAFVNLNRRDHVPMWIESVWEDADGTLYGWYHHERTGMCPNSNLSVPEIGALVSRDGGKSFDDLGIVLRSGDPPTCWAANGYFASGHGDFSVVLDQNREYFYFLFSTYGGDVSNQGVAIARMPFANLRNPVGAVWKYHGGSWSQPGLGGRVSTIFPATVGWESADTDSFWGPSIHWNTYLERYVVLMSRSCCWPDWPQEGVYLSMNADLSDPSGWTSPYRIIEGGDWYPWVKGSGAKETSSVAGQRVRLFMRSSSEWRIVFSLEPQSGAGWSPITASGVWTRVEPAAEPQPSH